MLSPIHFVPSIIAAILTILIYFYDNNKHHKILAYGMMFFAFLGLTGFLLGDWTDLLGFSFHSIHSWIGLFTLVLSTTAFLIKHNYSELHCKVGKFAAVLAFFSLLMGFIILLGLAPGATPVNDVTVQVPASSQLPEIEAKTFLNSTLTPISEQGNNAIEGYQVIDRETYRLIVDGLVNNKLELTYDDLLSLPAYSAVVYMPCVEGWGFIGKWTGFRLIDLLDQAEITYGGSYVVFHCNDGYTTGLPLTYIMDKRILLAYGLNDLTLSKERGFPLQLVAESKYGYKWAKWIIKIEVVDEVARGYWESRGYSESADVGTFPFG